MPRPQPKTSNLENDVRSLQSKLDLLVQKMNTFEKNMQVLGKTVVAVNERVKSVQAGSASQGGGANAAKLQSIEDDLNQLKQDVAEAKHTIDMVNPLEFVTRDVVLEMISDAQKKD